MASPWVQAAPGRSGLARSRTLRRTRGDGDADQVKADGTVQSHEPGGPKGCPCSGKGLEPGAQDVGKSSRASVWPPPDRQTDKSYCATVHDEWAPGVGKGTRMGKLGRLLTKAGAQPGVRYWPSKTARNERRQCPPWALSALPSRALFCTKKAIRPRDPQHLARRPPRGVAFRRPHHGVGPKRHAYQG